MERREPTIRDAARGIVQHVGRNVANMSETPFARSDRKLGWGWANGLVKSEAFRDECLSIIDDKTGPSHSVTEGFFQSILPPRTTGLYADLRSDLISPGLRPEVRITP